MLYNNLSGYLRKRFGKRLKKICIDGGFTCPNRDGKCSVGGCIFCGERGAGEHIDPTRSISEQVAAVLQKAADGDEFIAYFQNFTNTYASPDILKARYDAALTDDRIRVLAIGTRPDCIDREIAALIAEYKKQREVWVELGLQTANDKTAEVINRGYKLDCFERALSLLNEYSIPVVLHLIVGLPGEGEEEIKATAAYVSSLKVFGVKIHSIYVMKGTVLADMLERGEYTPPSLDEYVRGASEILTSLDEDVVIHRLTGDCPDGMLLAPSWSSNKHKVIDAITRYMKENGLSQGSKHKSANM